MTRIKRFTAPMKVFVTKLLTPYSTKTVVRERTSVETNEGEIKSPKQIEDALVKLMADVRASGLVVSIHQESVYPPAMGRYRDHITIRESREVVKMIMARPDPK